MSSKSVLANLSVLIKAKRKQRNLGLRAAAAECGLSASTLSRLEREVSRSLPDAETLAKLARWLNVSVEVLLCSQENNGRYTTTELKENDFVTICEHPVLKNGTRGKIVFFPTPKNAVVEIIELGECELISIKYLQLDSLKESTYSESSQSIWVSTPLPPDLSQQKSEIIIAFISILNALSDAELQKVGRAIALLERNKVESIVTGLLQTELNAEVMARVLANIYPEAATGVFENFSNKSFN